MDFQNADLAVEDQALCDFAVKLTRTPGDMGPGDIDRLRDHGFSDEAIVIATQVIGYFNYINRIADALGVDPEAWMEPSAEAWKAKKDS